MEAFELQVLWDGVEEFTGLWQVEFLARSRLHEDPTASARRALASLSEQGFVTVYSCRGLPSESTCDPIDPEHLTALLDLETSWEPPDEGDSGIWFDTTEEGFSAYKEESGWRS